ncbi:MAG: FMN-binding protein [Clostridia bacterium]|nr:FMN-binding protein [Clostridia bacterium]
MMEKAKKNTALEAVVIGLKLLLICAVIAAIVSFVYAMTLDVYEGNLQKTKNEAIGRIFGKEGLVCEKIGETTVYTVAENGVHIGYCVESVGKGFGGDIQMMVGYTADGKIVAVEVIGHSETPGVGDKVVKNTEYLANYAGLDGELAIGTDVDKVAGASVSSRGIMAGVNAATKALQDALANGGAE